MSYRRALPFVLVFALPLGSVTAQTCTGPKTSLPTIGQKTNPPASSAAISVSYSGTFKVSRSGVYTITGHVGLGRGAGSLADFTKVKATVNGKTVIDEDPPVIAGSPTNGWTYHWSIYYWQITKPFTTTQYLVANQTYKYDITATGYNRVVTQWHRRNYGVSMNGAATYCGPRATVKYVGSGCIGTNTPSISMPKPPVLGQRRDLVIQGRKSARGLCAFGLPAASAIYIGAGCNIYVNVALPYLPVPFATNSTGTGYVLFTIPNNPALAQLRVMSQAVVDNPGSAVGFDMTKGAEMTLGY